MPIAIIVHGGAGHVPAEHADEYKAGCKEAVMAGWSILQEGGTALDAVEAAVRVLEDNPIYNAGTGSGLTNEGSIEMDAGIMEGRTLHVGAVAGVELIKNPISLAHKVLSSPHVLLVGKGAQNFAIEQGMALCTFKDLLTEHRYQQWKERNAAQTTGEADGELARVAFFSQTNSPLPGHGRPQGPTPHIHSTPAPTRDPFQNDLPKNLPVQADGKEEKHGTIGAVALDAAGVLAAATSTGGMPNKYPGRVGDSPLIGCGFYADEHAAISCTGYGEDFIRLLIAKRAADIVACGVAAQDAAKATIAILNAKATGVGGLIIVDYLGNVGYAWNSEDMPYAYMHELLEEPVAGI